MYLQRTTFASPPTLRYFILCMLLGGIPLLAPSLVLAKPGGKAGPQQAIPLSVLAGAFEPVRGEDPTLPEELVAVSRGKTLVGSYRICVATSGSVHSVTPVVGIAGADQAIIQVLKGWRFQKLPLEICKTQTFTFEVP